jgi:hypothetical protein
MTTVSSNLSGNGLRKDQQLDCEEVLEDRDWFA